MPRSPLSSILERKYRRAIPATLFHRGGFPALSEKLSKERHYCTLSWPIPIHVIVPPPLYFIMYFIESLVQDVLSLHETDVSRGNGSLLLHVRLNHLFQPIYIYTHLLSSTIRLLNTCLIIVNYRLIFNTRDVETMVYIFRLFLKWNWIKLVREQFLFICSFFFFEYFQIFLIIIIRLYIDRASLI